MNRKDIGGKILMQENENFADILNATLFSGRQIVSADELNDELPRSSYISDFEPREQERDILKCWKNTSVKMAFLGIENQTTEDEYMPVRVLSYDSAQLVKQVVEKKKQKGNYNHKISPALTVVLYFNYKKRWDTSKSILDCMDVPPEIKPYLNDYKIVVIDVAFLEEEDLNLFKGDFRFVAEYFIQMRKYGVYKGSKEKVKDIITTLRTLSWMTDDLRFEDVFMENLSEDDEGRIQNMCEALDIIENRGIKKGFEQGIERGAEKTIADTAEKMLRENIATDIISRVTGLSEEKILQMKGA